MYFWCPVCRTEEEHEDQEAVIHCHQYPDDGSPFYVFLERYSEGPRKIERPLPIGGKSK